MTSIFEELDAHHKSGRITDVILLGWVYVENIINSMVLDEFEVMPFPDNIKADLLVNKLTFEEKYKFLKKLGTFTYEERKIIKEFQEQRNKIFHYGLEGKIFTLLYKADEKEKLAKLSIDSSNAVYNAFMRRKSKINTANFIK